MDSNAAQLPLSHKLWAWFETNKKQAFWGAGLVTIAVIVVAFVISQQGEKEVKASEALSSVAATPPTAAGARPDSAAAYLKVAADYPKSSAAARAVLLARGGGPPHPAAGARPDSAAGYLKVAADYPKSSAAARAVLLAGGSLFAQGKFAEAQGQFEKL